MLRSLSQMCASFTSISSTSCTQFFNVISNRIHRKDHLVNANVFIINYHTCLTHTHTHTIQQCLGFMHSKILYFRPKYSLKKKEVLRKEVSFQLVNYPLLFFNIILFKFYSENLFRAYLWVSRNI